MVRHCFTVNNVIIGPLQWLHIDEGNVFFKSIFKGQIKKNN